MSSTLVTPLRIYRPFGANAANPTYINLPIPDPSQISTTINAASFNDGFPPNTMTPEASGGLPFFGQDMNGILWMVSAYCANFAAGYAASYDATLQTAISGYPNGSQIQNADHQGYWLSVVNGNVTDPDTGGAGWYPLNCVGFAVVTLTTATTTLTPAQWRQPMIELNGTLTSNVTVILPTLELQWMIVNATVGAFTLTVKTAAGAGVVIPQTGFAAPTTVYCDATDIQNVGITTAGLAPINSPTLTGTPAAPTASPATMNTTQIATTAFVQAALTARLAAYATLASPTFTGSPAGPTAPINNNSLRLATTQYVDRAVATIPDYRAGTFASVNGVTTVAFSSALSFVPLVIVTPNYASPDYGWVVPGSISPTGFQYQNGNAGLMQYTAVKPV